MPAQKKKIAKTTYDKLTDVVKCAYEFDKTEQGIQERANQIWIEIKSRQKDPGFERDKATEVEIKLLVELAIKKKAEKKLFFARVSINIKVPEWN